MLQGAPEFDLEEQEEIGLSPSQSDDTIDRTSISRLSSPTSVISIMAEVLRDQIHRSHFRQNLAQLFQVGLHRATELETSFPPRGGGHPPQGSLPGETTPRRCTQARTGRRLTEE